MSQALQDAIDQTRQASPESVACEFDGTLQQLLHALRRIHGPGVQFCIEEDDTIDAWGWVATGPRYQGHVAWALGVRVSKPEHNVEVVWPVFSGVGAH